MGLVSFCLFLLFIFFYLNATNTIIRAGSACSALAPECSLSDAVCTGARASVFPVADSSGMLIVPLSGFQVHVAASTHRFAACYASCLIETIAAGAHHKQPPVSR